MLVAHRHATSEVIAERFDRLLLAKFRVVRGLTISVWWAIKAKTNLRHYQIDLVAHDAVVLPPVVLMPAVPLVLPMS